MSVVLLRNKKAAEYPLLPQSVYDDFADTGVSVITMPKGRWQIADTLHLQRSDVTVNFSGCTLMSRVDPATFDPVHVESVSVTSPVYPPGDPFNGNVVSRTLSHVSGTVVPSTTTLTMDADEVTDLQPGEEVLLWLGVDVSDPNEAQKQVVAVVESVNGLVITFTAPLGLTIIDYVDADGLAAAMPPDPDHTGQGIKIGAWGTYPLTSVGGNFAKGFGTDHGLERFVGGMVHDVTFNDPTIRVDRVTSFVDGSYAMFGIEGVALQRFTVNNYRLHNPFSSGLHLFRCFDTVVSDYQTTGHGFGRIVQGPSCHATANTIWGGAGFRFNRWRIRSTDTTISGAEVNATDLVVTALDYDVEFTARRSFSSSPTVYLSPGTWQGTNTITMRQTGGALPFFFASGQVFEGTLVLGVPLAVEFNWGAGQSETLSGLIAIDGVTYGPPITTTWDVTVLHGASLRVITPPVGLYTSITLQVIDVGDMFQIEDTSLTYSLAGDIVPLSETRWYVISAGAPALAAYRAKHLNCSLHNAGSTADGVIRFVATYLPEVV